MTNRRSVVPDALADRQAPDNNPAVLNGDAAAPPAADPFDPASLRLSGDAAAGLGVRKALLTIPVRKPDKTWWVRTHPNEQYQLQTAVIELKEERETYLVAQSL